MKKLLVLAVFCAAALALPALAAAARPIESATGGGTSTIFGADDYSFGFNAKNTSDGPKGQMQLTIEEGSLAGKIHAEVICLDVQGNDAWILGRVTKSTSTLFGPGVVESTLARLSFFVSDNGEGSGDPEDTIHFAPGLAVNTCEPALPGSQPLTGGNIQVRPAD